MNPIEQTSTNPVSQADFMKLFMQELTYQDPLKPIDNREFMAQMAQFSALQASQETNQYLAVLTNMMSSNQSLLLLGKYVRIGNSPDWGLVTSIKTIENAPPQLRINMNGQPIDKVLNDITEIRA